MKLHASHYGLDEYRREVVSDENCGHVCEMIERGEVGETKARLLAAAPDMLEALEMVERRLRIAKSAEQAEAELMVDGVVHRAITAALQKAGAK